MIAEIERLNVKLAQLDIKDVQALYERRVAVEADRRKGAEQYLLGQGYERIDVGEDALMTSDGREIVRGAESAWALRPEIHAQRLADAMEQARQRDAAMAEQQSQPTPPSQQQTTCTSLIDGQLCGGTLVRAAVCPRCALGRAGVAATLTCDVCGHVTAVMRGENDG